MGIKFEHVLSLFHDESTPNNYLKFGKFSPDGSLISTVGADNTLTIYENPLSKFCHTISSPTISRYSISDEFRDFSWFPRFSSIDEASKCFALTSRGHPVKLYSTSYQSYYTYKPQGYDGSLAESYSISFHPLGGLILIGLKNQLQIFDVINSPDPLQILGFGKAKIGIISTISFNVDGRRYLIGTHNGFLALCENTDYSFFSDSEYKQGGINQLYWLDDNRFLVGSRQDIYIREYDVRGGLVKRYNRASISTQKLPFCSYQSYIVSGTSDSRLLVINRTSSDFDRSYFIESPCGVLDLDGDLVLLGTGTRYPLGNSVEADLKTCGSRLNLYKIIECSNE